MPSVSECPADCTACEYSGTTLVCTACSAGAFALDQNKLCKSEYWFDSMGPNWRGSNFTSLFFKRILRIDILTISCEIGEWHRTPLMLINIGSGNGLLPSGHYLNQCWNIVNWTLRNILQWKFNRNPYIFILENAFEKVVCKMAAVLSQPQCVKVQRGPFIHGQCSLK